MTDCWVLVWGVALDSASEEAFNDEAHGQGVQGLVQARMSAEDPDWFPVGKLEVSALRGRIS